MGKVIFVDFKKGTVKQTKKSKKTEPKIKKNAFKNFYPIVPGSNFESFSDQERLEYSDHCIKHIHEVSFADLVHWANNGMIDMKKVDEKLKLNRPVESGPKVVGETPSAYLVEDDGGFINTIPKQQTPDLGGILGFGLDDEE